MSAVLPFRTRRDVDSDVAGRMTRATPEQVAERLAAWWICERWAAPDLRRARLFLGMSVEAASRLIGVHRNTYYNYETGRSFPQDFDTRAAVAAYICEARRIEEGT